MRNFILLFVAILLFHLAGTWTLPLIDRDEPRFAEASREMLQRGDYVVPFFNDHFRFDKPPLTYWLQTISYRSLGQNDFAARLPSAIAAALTAVLLLAWGERLGPARIGWWAAIIFTTAFQTFLHAKAAVADMWLVLFMTAAQWAGYELLRDRLTSGSAPPARRWWWIFYLSLALAFLAKGPIGWAPLLTLAVLKFLRRDLRLNERFLFAPGLAFMLTLVAIWGVPALLRTHGEFFRIGIGRQVLARSVVVMEGHGGGSIVGYIATLPFYFVLIFVTFFPWSMKLPWLTKRLLRGRDPLDLYLISGAGVIFVIFTLVQTKLPHYTLPAFPLLALLLAKAWSDLPQAERFVRRTAIAFAAVALLATAATPWVAHLFPSWDLARQARRDLTPPMEFGAIAYREPSLVWYFRRSINGWMTELDEHNAREFMARSGPRFIVLPTSLMPALYPQLPATWKSFSTRGVSTVNGQRVELTLLLKPS
ncbi:MAG: glycosyltransferase family 39 protein [Verrucomicrobiota bacterium]|nr:glycosyltransferase family 39 protein [Verrucomicrobiota bacterium]